MISLDAKRIVKRFGGRIELWRRLSANGQHISVKTIEKWMERNSIPSARLLRSAPVLSRGYLRY